MTTQVLPAGSRKLIVPNVKAAEQNHNRAQALGSRFRPVYAVLVLSDAGEVTENYAADLGPFAATLRASPNTLQKLLPSAKPALRAVTEDRVYFWAETTDALTLQLP